MLAQELGDLPVTYLSCTEGSHNKWYIVVELPQNGRAFAGYGPHGKEGTWREVSLAEGKKLVWEKTQPKKGYQRVPSGKMDKLALLKMQSMALSALGVDYEITDSGSLRAKGKTPAPPQKPAASKPIDMSWADNW
jgi:hypothetical protein